VRALRVRVGDPQVRVAMKRTASATRVYAREIESLRRAREDAGRRALISAERALTELRHLNLILAQSALLPDYASCLDAQLTAIRDECPPASWAYRL
jgi:hypothetical protein